MVLDRWEVAAPDEADVRFFIEDRFHDRNFFLRFLVRRLDRIYERVHTRVEWNALAELSLFDHIIASIDGRKLAALVTLDPLGLTLGFVFTPVQELLLKALVDRVDHFFMLFQPVTYLL